MRDGCVFLSFNLTIDSVLRVCHMMNKLNLHLVYVISFFKNFQLSTSFPLQKGRRIPSLGLSSNQWTGIIVSSVFGFSKSWMTSFTNFAGYPALMNDCLMTLTSAFQLVAIRLIDVRHLGECCASTFLGVSFCCSVESGWLIGDGADVEVVQVWRRIFAEISVEEVLEGAKVRQRAVSCGLMVSLCDTFFNHRLWIQVFRM